MQKALIALSVFLAFGGLSAYTYNRTVGFAIFVGSKADAEKNLETYAHDMSYKLVGKSCAETDSDRDGYITCTARVQEGEGGPVAEKYLECGSGAWGARTGGCKPKLGVFPMQPMQQPAAQPQSR